MANRIKFSGVDGLALQVTKSARSAGLVEEGSEGDSTYLANVRVFAFDHLLLVIDRTQVRTEDTAELVVAAAQDTKSMYRGIDATVQIAGNGYQVQLLPAVDAGFGEGDRAPCRSAPGVLALSRDDSTSTGADSSRLAKDIVTMRSEQI